MTRAWVCIVLPAFLYLLGCKKREFNQESDSQSLYSFSQPRFAFEHAGLGWCTYIEDTSKKPEMYRTNHIYTDVSYDFDTQTIRRDRYQRNFTLRSFKKFHEASFEFNAFSKWAQPLFSNSSMTSEVFTAIVEIEKEISLVGTDLDVRRHTKLMCEKRLAEDDAARKQGLTLSNEDFALEYRLRCQVGSDQHLRHTEAIMLSPPAYKLMQQALRELANDDKWKSYRRTGVKCRDEIRQLESSRGRYLGSESTKE